MWHVSIRRGNGVMMTLHMKIGMILPLQSNCSITGVRYEVKSFVFVIRYNLLSLDLLK
jgi:hypothetical protein